MKKHLLKSLLALALVLICGNAWGEEEVYYTLDGTITGGTSEYAAESEITQNSMTWNVTGNTTMSPWRIGGKSISDVDRTVYSKTAMGSAITKVELEVGEASSITVNSLTLTVASDAAFGTVIDEVTASFAANSTIKFSPTSPETEWATGAYYKFTFNVTVTGSSNRFVQFKSANFYKKKNTSLLDCDLALTGAPVSLTFDLYNNSDPQVISYTTSSTGAVTVVASGYATFAVDTENKKITVTPTAVTLSDQTITVNQAETASYRSGSTTFTLKVTDSTPFTGGDVTFTAGTDKGTTDANNTPDEVNKSVVTISSDNAAFATAQYRLYSGSTTTISTSQGTITQIVFTKNGDSSLANLSTTTGSYDSSTGTWTGNASSVAFSASAQVRLDKIVVTVDPSGVVAPSISASDVSIAHDATGGSIAFTISNEPDPAGTLTASVPSGSWITPGSVTSGEVPFTCEANTGVAARTETVTLTYTYDTDKTVTKDVTVTQAMYIAPYTAALVAYNGQMTEPGYFAMKNVVSSNKMEAISVDVVNEKVVWTEASTQSSITWKITEDGDNVTIQDSNNKYLTAGASSTNLTLGDTQYTFTKDATNDTWLNGTRSFFHNGTVFGGYAISNIDKTSSGTPYSGYTHAYPIVDGHVRAVTADNLGTVCFPYDVAAGDFSGVKFYSIEGKRVDGSGNPTSIVLDEATALAAGTPYLFIAEADKLVCAFSGSPVAAPVTTGTNGLVGTFEAGSVDEGMYAAYGTEIVKAGTGVTIAANRAYINMDDVPVYKGSSSAVELRIGGATGIQAVNADADATIYDLQGRTVVNPQSGLYIVNGKKVLVK